MALTREQAVKEKLDDAREIAPHMGAYTGRLMHALIEMLEVQEKIITELRDEIHVLKNPITFELKDPAQLEVALPFGISEPAKVEPKVYEGVEIRQATDAEQLQALQEYVDRPANPQTVPPLPMVFGNLLAGFANEIVRCVVTYGPPTKAAPLYYSEIRQYQELTDEIRSLVNERMTSEAKVIALQLEAEQYGANNVRDHEKQIEILFTRALPALANALHNLDLHAQGTVIQELTDNYKGGRLIT